MIESHNNRTLFMLNQITLKDQTKFSAFGTILSGGFSAHTFIYLFAVPADEVA